MKKILSLNLLFVLIISTLLMQVVSLVKPQENVVFASMKNQENSLNLPVKAYFLMDFNTGKTLSNFNEEERLEVASMVKLMTTLLTMEKIEKGEWTLDTKLITSDYAASMEGSQAFLDAGCDYTVDELLKSIIVASANDSCVMVAENMAGSEQNFVNLMNERAGQLAMNNTLYANSTGLPATTQYSCAKDIAKILKEVYKHDIYHKYSTIWMDKIIHKSGRETELVNTNRLIRYYEGCDSGKTGFTDEAGYCLSASAKRNNMRLISVVIGAKTSADRFETSSKLLNYGFANFENKKIIDSNTAISQNFVLKGIRENIEAFCEKDLYCLLKRGQEKNNVELKIKFDEKTKAPIKQNQSIGKVYLVEDGVVVDECNLIVKKDYNKQTYKESLKQIFDNFSLI